MRKGLSFYTFILPALISSFLLFILVGVFSYPSTFADEIPDYKTAVVEINGQQFYVDIARTLEEQFLGLSGRVSLPYRSGMLFVYEQPGIYGFWMKDMNFDLDFIWIDENNKIIDISHSVLPESYPQSYVPPSDVLYVLEVSAGTANRLDLSVGDYVHIIYN